MPAHNQDWICGLVENGVDVKKFVSVTRDHTPVARRCCSLDLSPDCYLLQSNYFKFTGQFAKYKVVLKENTALLPMIHRYLHSCT